MMSYASWMDVRPPVTEMKTLARKISADAMNCVTRAARGVPRASSRANDGGSVASTPAANGTRAEPPNQALTPASAPTATSAPVKAPTPPSPRRPALIATASAMPLRSLRAPTGSATRSAADPAT